MDAESATGTVTILRVPVSRLRTSFQSPLLHCSSFIRRRASSVSFSSTAASHSKDPIDCRAEHAKKQLKDNARAQFPCQKLAAFHASQSNHQEHKRNKKKQSKQQLVTETRRGSRVSCGVLRAWLVWIDWHILHCVALRAAHVLRCACLVSSGYLSHWSPNSSKAWRHQNNEANTPTTATPAESASCSKQKGEETGEIPFGSHKHGGELEPARDEQSTTDAMPDHTSAWTDGRLTPDCERLEFVLHLFSSHRLSARRILLPALRAFCSLR